MIKLSELPFQMTQADPMTRSFDAQKQEELLESFVNVKQYDKLLFYLESTLFNNAPNLNCPSPFIINCLFTLATLGEYNNADLIRKEFDKPLSAQPVHKRAVNVLRKLVDIAATKGNQAMGKNNFQRTRYNPDDVIQTRNTLKKSLELIRKAQRRELRPRTVKKRYKEKVEQEFDEFASSSNDADGPINSTDWSPQKKLLEQQFQKLKGPAVESDTESESEGEGSLDRKSYYILKNERFDIALQGDKFWAAVSWALYCASSRERIHLEAWKVWKPILELIFDIAAFDLEDFIEAKKSNTDDENGMTPMFTNTSCYRLLNEVGRYYTLSKIVDILFINSRSKVEPIFDNELTKTKSVYLADFHSSAPQDAEYTFDSMILRKKILYLAAEATINSNSEEFGKHSTWKLRDLARQTTLKLMDASYVDFRTFFTLDVSEISEDWKLELILDILFDFFVQVNTFVFDLPEPSWVYDKSPDFIMEMLTNVTYEKKFYDFNEGLNIAKMERDFEKLNLSLFVLLNVWLTCSNYVLASDRKIQETIEWCRIGEEKRRNALKTAQPNGPSSDLFSIVKMVELQFNSE